jgi:hypothetical protein
MFGFFTAKNSAIDVLLLTFSQKLWTKRKKGKKFWPVKIATFLPFASSPFGGTVPKFGYARLAYLTNAGPWRNGADMNNLSISTIFDDQKPFDSELTTILQNKSWPLYDLSPAVK